MEQELPSACRLVDLRLAEPVGRDVKLHNPQLVALDHRVRFVQRGLFLAQALDLGSMEGDPAFELFQDLEPVGSLAIPANDVVGGLRGRFHCINYPLGTS